jgi:RND family efflux transporter MFP subunit
MKGEADVKLTVWIALLLAASLGAGCISTPQTSTTEASPAAVSVARAEVVDLPALFEAGGIIRARATAVIASRMMAPVAEVHVRPGDRVRRGARLVTLDARATRADSARASAALVSALEAARATESDTRAADAALRLARATYERISALHSRRSATPQELDQAAAGLSAAEAQRSGAEARAAAAAAARDAARASVEGAEIGVSYAVLSAPFDGIVTGRTVDPGSMAVPGAPLLVLEDPAIFRLEVHVDEARAAWARVGQTVSVRVDEATASSDGWTAAQIAEVARIDPASHSFLVKVDIPGAPTLRSGLFGRARFAGPVRRALTVPSSALLRRGQLTFVFAIDADGLARLRPISTGAIAHDRVEALAGVRDGDLVVTNPPASLSDGTRVAVRQASSVSGAGDVR